MTASLTTLIILENQEKKVPISLDHQLQARNTKYY